MRGTTARTGLRWTRSRSARRRGSSTGTRSGARRRRTRGLWARCGHRCAGASFPRGRDRRVRGGCTAVVGRPGVPVTRVARRTRTVVGGHWYKLPLRRHRSRRGRARGHDAAAESPEGGDSSSTRGTVADTGGGSRRERRTMTEVIAVATSDAATDTAATTYLFDMTSSVPVSVAACHLGRRRTQCRTGAPSPVFAHGRVRHTPFSGWMES
jgi:hypothetical protein